MNLIQIRQGENTLVLQGAGSGAGSGAPFRGAVFEADAAAVGQSTLALALEGTPAQIETGLARLGALLEEARRWFAVPGGEHVYLEARVTPGAALWRSRLSGGCILPASAEAGAHTRALGRQAVRLALARCDWWEGPEVELPLSNPHGGGVTGGLEIDNCWDATRANYADIAADALPEAVDLPEADAVLEPCDLPSPLILDFAGIDADYTGTLYAFQNIYSSPTALMPVIEGETGTPGSDATGVEINDPSASGGQYQRLAWSGEAETHLWTGTLFPGVIEKCAGRPFLPLARLANPLFANERIWHFWRTSVSWDAPETLLDSPGCYLPIGASLCPGVPVFLPPWPVRAGESPVALRLELHAQAAGTGSHQLDLDYLTLLPLDGWRIYRPALTGWGSSLRVYDDPVLGLLRSGSYGIQTHTAEGPGLWYLPGRAARCHFLIERASGAYLPGTRSRVRLFCRPRRKVL